MRRLRLAASAWNRSRNGRCRYFCILFMTLVCMTVALHSINMHKASCNRNRLATVELYRVYICMHVCMYSYLPSFLHCIHHLNRFYALCVSCILLFPFGLPFPPPLAPSFGYHIALACAFQDIVRLSSLWLKIYQYAVRMPCNLHAYLRHVAHATVARYFCAFALQVLLLICSIFSSRSTLALVHGLHPLLCCRA